MLKLNRVAQPIHSFDSDVCLYARGSEGVRIPVGVPANAGADVLTLNLRAVDERGLQINERNVLLEQAGATHSAWTKSLPRQGEPIVTASDAQVQVALPQWVLTVQRVSGELTIRDHAGKMLLAGIYPHSGRKPTMAETLRAKNSGLWLSSMLTRLEAPAVKVEQRDGKVHVAISGHYPLPADAKATAPAAAGAAQKFDDLIPGAQSATVEKAKAEKVDSKGAGLPSSEGPSGAYELEINPNGAIEVRYDFAPGNASGFLSEAGLSIVAPPAMGEFRWIGQGPYAGYPGKDRLNEFGLFHLNRDDLYFQGNRRDTVLAMLTTPEGSGFAMALTRTRPEGLERQDAGNGICGN